jgi:hypothetical protein
MKTKIILTIIVAAFYFGGNAIWNTIKSPVTGTVTAAQLNDTAQSYVVARAVRENFVENTIGFSALLLTAMIWLVPTNRKNKSL